MKKMMLTGVLMLSLSCSDSAPLASQLPSFGAQIALEPRSPEARTERVVLVVLDGVRWQDIYGAAPMPTLRRWMTRDGVGLGGFGEMRASGPAYVSLPGYNEIFSGRTPECQSNHCEARREPTLVDELVDAGRDVAVVSSWESIELAASRDPERFPCSTGRLRLHGGRAFDADVLRDGHDADSWPGIGEFRRDALTARVALDVLSTSAPRFVFVGLGEPDEYAHRGDVDGYFDALRAADAVLADIEARVDARTSIFVTTDHGRNAAFRDHGGGWPESGRVWLVAKGGAVPRRGVSASSGHRLADIAPTIRALLGIRADSDPRAGHVISEIAD